MQASPKKAASLWARRQILLQLPKLCLGGALLVQACKKKDKSTTPSPPETTSSGNEVVSPYPKPVTPQPPSSGNQCMQEGNRIDLRGLGKAGENLEAYFKFYGDTASTMMVMDLPKYQHGNLLEVYVVRPSGELLAQKGIGERADINADTTLRTLVFDNIQLRSDRSLVVVYKTKCDDCTGGFEFTKFEMSASIGFSNTFNSKRVYSLTPNSLPSLHSEHAAVATIGPDPAANKRGYAAQSDDYMVATSEAIFMGSGSLKDFVVTDLMGRILAQKGEDFHDIFRHPHFICYKLVDNMFYIRTFVRLT